jgi:hypothetical protein
MQTACHRDSWDLGDDGPWMEGDVMQPHLSGISDPRQPEGGWSKWPGTVMVIVTVMITNNLSIADVKTVLSTLLGMIAVHVVVNRGHH